MDTPKALFAGLALIAAAIVADDFIGPRYEISVVQGGAWVVDTETERFRTCSPSSCRDWRSFSDK